MTKERKKDIPAIQFKEQILCKCKTNCSIKIDVARQKALFEAYYENSNHVQKVLTVVSSVTSEFAVHNKRRRYFPIHKSKKQKNSHKYRLLDDSGVHHLFIYQFIYLWTIFFEKKTWNHAWIFPKFTGNILWNAMIKEHEWYRIICFAKYSTQNLISLSKDATRILAKLATLSMLHCRIPQLTNGERQKLQQKQRVHHILAERVLHGKNSIAVRPIPVYSVSTDAV